MDESDVTHFGLSVNCRSWTPSIWTPRSSADSLRRCVGACLFAGLIASALGLNPGIVDVCVH